jgi:hypothetical protein
MKKVLISPGNRLKNPAVIRKWIFFHYLEEYKNAKNGKIAVETILQLREQFSKT